MYLIFISEALLFAFNKFIFMSYLLSLSGGSDGKILVFDHLCVLDTVCYSLGLYPFSALNPDCFIRIIWDSPWYLVSISGWYHHVWCILYTNDVILGALCVLPGSVGVACSPMLPVSCGGIGCEPVSSICHSSSWWGCEYSTFCWQNYTVNFAVSCCILATLLTGRECH